MDQNNIWGPACIKITRATMLKFGLIETMAIKRPNPAFLNSCSTVDQGILKFIG
jgi:hypothetical protein